MGRYGIAVSLLFLPLSAGCLTFSSFQSARIVDPEQPRTTVALSKSDFLEQDQEEAGWLVLEIQNRFGLTRSTDAAFKASVTRRMEDGWVGLVVTADARHSIWKDRLTFALPASLLLGDFDFATLQLHPGFIATLPISRHLEVSGSAQAYLFVRVEELSTFGYTLGLGWSPHPDRWMLRPEIAWIHFGDDNDLYTQIGMGVEFPMPKR